MKNIDSDITHTAYKQDNKRRFFLWIGIASIIVSCTLIGLDIAIETGPPAAQTRTLFMPIRANKPPRLEPRLEYTGEDYRELWRNVTLANVEPRATDYPITGDETADTYIRTLGEKRGYERQVVATGGLVSIDGYLMQETTRYAWRQLTAAAASQGVQVSLRLSSGHRDANEQAELFATFLRNNLGYQPDADDITSGKVDAALDRTLDRVAPPGYSKHHTGYTLDICDALYNACATRFAGTQGEQWLRKDNYANARAFGFIPSYPPDVEKQGPNPEPWEYVWIGIENLTLDFYIHLYKDDV